MVQSGKEISWIPTIESRPCTWTDRQSHRLKYLLPTKISTDMMLCCDKYVSKISSCSCFARAWAILLQRTENICEFRANIVFYQLNMDQFRWQSFRDHSWPNTRLPLRVLWDTIYSIFMSSNLPVAYGPSRYRLLLANKIQSWSGQISVVASAERIHLFLVRELDSGSEPT